MSTRKRRNHASAFKAQVAVAAVKGDKTLAELAQHFDVHPNQITDWKTQLLERAAQVFGDGPAKPETCSVPDDCRDPKRRALFVSREVMRGLIDELCSETA